MTSSPDPVRELIERIADGDPIDWHRAADAEVSLLDALHTLDQVRNAYHRIGATTAPQAAPLFHWGPLAVLEKIGSGATAEVYRAWDRGLATTVALKLLRPEAAAAGLRSDDFLREGRLLAQLSRRNVLRVYGAAVHDGRPGIWNEWIEGRTLDAIVGAEGPLADAEAVYVGLELCAALAAIHSRGLLHGDVKASNAMRARGGRIVLTDLGAAGVPDVLNASLHTQATPAYLSPQSRGGGTRSKADDLYALGVLLHFLLSGDYPRDGKSRLRELKPDISSRLAETIERALDAEPQARFADAHAFADALRAAIDAQTHPSQRRSRRWLPAAAALAFAIAAGLVAWALQARAWRPEAELVRRTDTGSEPLRDGARLQAGDRVDLVLSANRPTWVYVLNEDAAGDFHVLFPLAGLELTNPLSGGDDITLPGRVGARSLSWEVSGTGAREEFLVLLARAPLTALDRRLDTLPAVDIGGAERGVARARPNPPSVVQLAGEHLNAVLADIDDEIADPDRVRVRAWRFNDSRAE